MWRVGHGSSQYVPETGAADLAEHKGTTNRGRNPVELHTGAPVSIPKTQKTSAASAAFGFMKPVVLATMLGAGLVIPTGASAQQVQGAPLDQPPIVISMPPQTFNATPSLQTALNEQHTILVQPTDRPANGEKTRGEIVLDQLARELEALMQVTARDMANPNTPFIEGMPGYREPDRDQALRLIERAFRQIPLGELPGGRALAALVNQLPNAGHLDAEKMSFDELSRAVGDANVAWLEAKFKPLVEGHELEVGLVAFGAITAARAASPDVAGGLDRIIPAITVWRTQSDDGNSDARVRLRYRNEEIMPNIDIRARTARHYGPYTVHGELEGRISLENERHVTGTATAGASWNQDGRFVDASATYFDNGQSRVTVTGGVVNPQTRSLTFGTMTAELGRNPNRIHWELDYDRLLQFPNANGSIGAYAGYSMNTDGSDGDLRAGFVFRLRW